MRLKLIVLVGLLSFANSAFAASAVETSGVRGGLVVHVGAGDGKTLAELGAGDGFLVQGLGSDPADVAAARKHLLSEGLYGKVSVGLFDNKTLPYSENLVNLLIVDQPKTKIAREEILRVLVPNGVALVDGKKIVKPMPGNIDEWSHFEHGPENNSVAADTVVGPPRHLQWVSGPRWLRSHEVPSGITSIVTAGGRLFYTLDEGPIGVTDTRLPEKWSLIARDAFNGVLLWKRPIEEWGWKHWTEQAYNGAAARFMNPHQLLRRLVAVGDTVYVTPGIFSAVHALDAATGEVIRKYPGTEKTFEIVCLDGTLVLAVNRALDDPGAEPDVSVMAVDADKGAIPWESGGYKGIAPKVDTLKRYVDSSLTVGGGQVFLVDQADVIGLDLETGEEKWRVKRPERPVDATKGRRLPFDYYYPDLCATVYSDNVLYFSQILHTRKNLSTKNKKGAVLFAVDITTGRKLWSFDCVTFAHFTPPDIFVNRGLVWTLEDESQSMVGLDPRTGEKKQGFEVSEMLGWQGGHHNCYRNKATERFIFTAKEKGTDYVDLETGEKNRRNWIKGACRYGLMPANGMLYFPSHNCRCYITSKLNGFFALSGDPEGDLPPSTESAREKGPAYGTALKDDVGASDWPTYRHDSMRSGQVDAALPEKLAMRWTSNLGGRLTQPTIAGSHVYVASVDQHRVHCLDRTSGEPVWSHMAGGRVDSPPSYYRGLLVFGSRDGAITCLDAAKGDLVWRFRAAPADMRISAFGQMESAWPAFGSLIVQDGKVYCSAGRSTNLNGGIYLYALDVNTGLPLRSHRAEPDFESHGEMDGSVMSDILVGNDEQFHIRGVLFDMENLECVGGGPWGHKQEDRDAAFPFLKAYGGFLDDSWYNASYLIYGSRPNVGHQLVIDQENQTVYGVRGFSKYGSGGSFTEDIARIGETGHTLFSNQTTGGPDSADGQAKRRGKEKSSGSKPNGWNQSIEMRPLAMVAGRENLCVVGVADKLDEQDYWKHLEGRAGGILAIHSRSDGSQRSSCILDSAPVFNGLAAAGDQVFVSGNDGSVICLGAAPE